MVYSDTGGTTLLRFPVRTAVTWRIVAEIFRRHHPLARLRLLEMHPGGGQTDCLALQAARWPDQGSYLAFTQGELTTLCYLNQDSQHLHVLDHFGEP